MGEAQSASHPARLHHASPTLSLKGVNWPVPDRNAERLAREGLWSAFVRLAMLAPRSRPPLDVVADVEAGDESKPAP
jgi:hypothetical protein